MAMDFAFFPKTKNNEHTTLVDRETDETTEPKSTSCFK